MYFFMYSHNYVVIYEKFSEPPPGPDLLFFIYSGNSENTPNVHWLACQLHRFTNFLFKKKWIMHAKILSDIKKNTRKT